MNDQAFKLLMERFNQQDRELMYIKKDIKSLLQFKWQIIGGAATLSAFTTILVNGLIYILNNG